MNRSTINVNVPTPWGQSDTGTWYASGIIFYSTPSHGGFNVARERLARMPEPYRSQAPYCGQAGWYEEDCDWCLVALSFPEFFTEPELEAAHRTWDWMQERKAQDAKGVA